MGTNHPRRGPSLVLIILVTLSYVVTLSNSETLTSLNDLHSWETHENNASLSNPQLSEEEKYTKQNDSGDSQQVHEKSSTHSMNHRKHQQSLSASNKENADIGTRDVTTSANNGNDERNNRYGEDDGGSRRPPVPSLGNGGGIAGALRRLVGTVPMLASKLSSHMGFSRRKRHLNDYPLIPQHHMATIENLNNYYSSLTNSSTGERPTPEQVKVHRKYLLDLLQQMTSPNRGDNPDHIGIFKNDVMSTLPEAHKQNPTQSVLTKSQQELLTSSSSRGTASPSFSGNYGPNEHNDPTKFFMNIPRANKPGVTSETQFASRMGQVPSDHNVDIQNLPIEKAALLLHQLQTQGQVNLLPPNFLGQVPGAAQEPPRGLEAMFSQNEAVKRMGNPAGASRTDPPRHADDLLQQPPWSYRSRPTQSLTSANIDPISGHHYPTYHSPESLTTSSGNPTRVSVPEVYDKPIPALPGTYISEDLAQPTLSDFGQVQAISQIEEGKLVLPQDLSNMQNQHIATGSASILDNFPDQSALINPQNFPDLIEGLKVLSSSDHNPQPLSLADIMEHLPIEFFLNSNGYSDHEFLLNALRIIQQYNNFQGTNSQNKVDSTVSHPQNLLELTLPTSSGLTNVNQLYNQGHAQSIAPAASAARPQAVPVRGDLVPNTRFTDTLSTAFEDLKTDIVDAITKFVKSLADAIEDQPALLLLGLIPLAFLFFSLFQHFGVSVHYMGKGNNSGGGHSSGGHSSYGRKSFVSRNPNEEAEILATRILTNIDRFENWQRQNFLNS